jgi:hypothetical protein
LGPFRYDAIVERGAKALIRLASFAHNATDDAGRVDLSELPSRLDEIGAWIEDLLLRRRRARGLGVTVLGRRGVDHAREQGS